MLDEVLTKLLEWILKQIIKKYGVEVFENALLINGFVLQENTPDSKIYIHADGAQVAIHDSRCAYDGCDEPTFRGGPFCFDHFVAERTIEWDDDCDTRMSTLDAIRGRL